MEDLNYEIKITMDARKIDSRGESAARLARNIACVKYTLFCFNIVAWVCKINIR